MMIFGATVGCRDRGEEADGAIDFRRDDGYNVSNTAHPSALKDVRVGFLLWIADARV